MHIFFDNYILTGGEIFLCVLVLHSGRFSVNLIIGLHLFPKKISENECQLLTIAKTNGKKMKIKFLEENGITSEPLSSIA